jgi:hypothetical protein
MIVLCPAGNGATAAYDPVADHWRPINMQGSPVCCSYPPVWTGQELIILNMRHSARYDPETDTWKPVASHPDLSNRYSPAVVWDGTGVLVWGGLRLGPFALFDDGFRYIPPARLSRYMK